MAGGNIDEELSPLLERVVARLRFGVRRIQPRQRSAALYFVQDPAFEALLLDRKRCDLQGVPGLVQRLAQNPIESPSSSPTIGDNINGPSLIRVPS